MGFLAGFFAKIAIWILETIGRVLFKEADKFIDKKKQEKKEKETLKDYQDAVKRGANDSELLEKERNLINGD